MALLLRFRCTLSGICYTYAVHTQQTLRAPFHAGTVVRPTRALSKACWTTLSLWESSADLGPVSAQLFSASSNTLRVTQNLLEHTGQELPETHVSTLRPHLSRRYELAKASWRLGKSSTDLGACVGALTHMKLLLALA